MLRGFYTAASGMMAQQRFTEIMSNNIANMNTPGFKADQAVLKSFPELLIQQVGNQNASATNGIRPAYHPIGLLATGVYTQESVMDFSQGPVRETGIQTDVAIVNGNFPDENGGVFFALENEAGEVRYTRNGHFTIDAEGFLTANNGYYVLDNQGNRIQVNDTSFIVSDTGAIEFEDGETMLQIAYIADVHQLTKETGDMYQLNDGNAALAPETEASFQILQGTLEGSNVDQVAAMTEMMAAYRNFEQNQKVLRAYDESMGKAVTEIARLR